MKKAASIASCMLILFSLHAQTCVGTFNLKLFDPKTKKPLSGKLQKSIAYVFTRDESEFYDDIGTVISMDSVRKSKQGYTVRVNEKGYSFFSSTDPAWISFPTLCGLYLIHMDFYGRKDTMSLSFYNIPAHQSFQIDTVLFRKGEYFMDFRASTRLHEFDFLEDKGYFQLPAEVLQPLPKKE